MRRLPTVDTGSDDAVAVMCGVLSKDIEVLACCTVWGNLPVANTTENTLRVLEALGRGDIPVYTGCDTAMVKYLCQNRVPERVRQPVYSEEGKEIQVHYAYLEELSPAKGKAQPMDAPSFYVASIAEGTHRLA